MGCRTRTCLVAAALAASCLVGCNRPADTYTVYIDPAFDAPGSAHGTSEVLEALDDWTAHVPGLVLRPVVSARVCDDSCAHSITLHPSTIASLSARPGASESEAGVTSRRGTDDWRSEGDWANVWIAQDAPRWQVSLRHEIGHALALQHTAAGTLMYRDSTGAAPGVTCEDLAQYERVRGRPAGYCPAG